MVFFLVSSFQMLVLLIGGCLSGAHQGLLTHPFEQVLADYLCERYFFFSERFREIANWNNILRINRYNNRIFHIQNLKGRIKEEKERQRMVVEWIATKAFSPLLMMEVVSSASQGSLSMMSKAAVDPDPPTPDPDAIKMFVGQVPRSMEEVNFVIYMGLNICNEIGLARLFINPWKAVIQFSTYGTRS